MSSHAYRRAQLTRFHYTPSMSRLVPSSSHVSLYLLGAASGISPFGMAIIVPALANIAADFGSDLGQVQWLVSAYLFGLAVAQPLHGFACDRFGRRPVMLGGFLLFTIASLAGVLANTLEQLILLRALQAIGVSVGTVASRAVVRDTRDAHGAAVALSYIAAATGLAPIVAPMLGGWLSETSGYRAVFAATGGMGALVLTWMWIGLPETRDPLLARPRWRDWLDNYRTLITCPSFVGYSLTFGFVQGSFFSFLAVGAMVFERDFAIGAREFGVLWGFMAIAYVIGAVGGARLTRALGSHKAMRTGVVATVAGGLLLPLVIALAGMHKATVIVPLLVMMMAAGTVTPGALAGAVNAHPHRAGTASGLSSAIGLVVGGLFTIGAGRVYQQDFMPVALLIAGATFLTALSWYIAQRRASRSAWRPEASE